MIFLQSSYRSGSLSSNSQNPELDDDIDYSISKDELCLQQKVNLVASINTMRMMPMPKSRMRIPLCMMVYMPMIWPTLDSDLKKLEQEFVHGY
jgi:hypothetical protein